MPTQLTPAQLKSYFTGQMLDPLYSDALELYNELRVHADGLMPVKLIKEARPNESPAVQKYRQSIYEAETQNPVERVLGVLEKIRRSPDWMIQFDDEKLPRIINEEETPYKYLREKYPVYNDIEGWLFEEALRVCAIDANAVVAILPKSFEVQPTEYIEPVAQLFNCDKVIKFETGDYCVLKSDELSSLLTPDEQDREQKAAASFRQQSDRYEGFIPGQVYYVITTNEFTRWEQNKEGYQLTATYVHGLGELPAFKIPGKFVRRLGNATLKKTALQPMVPHLNKAARESNDLDAGVIMHLFPERWRINNTQCNDCNGTGKVPSDKGPVECGTCHGSGMGKGKSPFNEIEIKPAALGQNTNVQIPPVGYVVKDSTIIELQNKRVQEHIYKALAAVNMEHLSEVQLNQSGVAKQLDRDELNTLIYTMAEILCALANTAIYWITELRYKGIVPGEKERLALLPSIPVPSNFDVITASMLTAEYKAAKEAGLPSIILTEKQNELASKMFYAAPKTKVLVQLVMDLDPFPDKTVDEKGAMLTGKLATQQDIVLSNYIRVFVARAIEEDKTFIDKSTKDKETLLRKYADEKIAQLSTAVQIQQDMFGNANNDNMQVA